MTIRAPRDALILILVVLASAALPGHADADEVPCNNVTLTTGDPVCIQPGSTVFGQCKFEQDWSRQEVAAYPETVPHGDFDTVWCVYPLMAPAAPATLPHSSLDSLVDEPVWSFPFPDECKKVVADQRAPHSYVVCRNPAVGGPA